MAENDTARPRRGNFSPACFMFQLAEPGTSPVCGPAFFSTEPIDPELFDDHGPAEQLLAASMPMHDVYISATISNPNLDNCDCSEDFPNPVDMMAWDLLSGVLFFASGYPITCR